MDSAGSCEREIDCGMLWRGGPPEIRAPGALIDAARADMGARELIGAQAGAAVSAGDPSAARANLLPLAPAAARICRAGLSMPPDAARISQHGVSQGAQAPLGIGKTGPAPSLPIFASLCIAPGGNLALVGPREAPLPSLPRFPTRLCCAPTRVHHYWGDKYCEMARITQDPSKVGKNCISTAGDHHSCPNPILPLQTRVSPREPG